MFLGLFQRQDLVAEEDVRWLFDAFAWSLSHFGRDVFFDETALVVPDNAHFPGSADNVADMGGLIFDHVRRYAGMQHWPVWLAAPGSCTVAPVPTLESRGLPRGSKAVDQTDPGEGNAVILTYDSNLVGNPEALIASFAHALAYYLGQTSSAPPPGGVSYWPQATEALAVFMGFGLMFANSAFNVPVHSCSSCGGPQVQRRSYLTQYESTYALAIFSVLKGIPAHEVVRHLKKHLRSFYRSCVKEVQRKPDELERLRSVPDGSPIRTAATVFPP